MFLYLIHRVGTNRFYIGQTIGCPGARWNRHCRDARLGSKYAVHRAIRKYGRAAFAVDIILETESRDDLNISEFLCIAAFSAAGFRLYNRTNGGEGGKFRCLTEQQKKRIAASVKAEHARNPKKRTPESKERMSEIMKRFQKTHPNHFGKYAQSFRKY